MGNFLISFKVQSLETIFAHKVLITDWGDGKVKHDFDPARFFCPFWGQVNKVNPFRLSHFGQHIFLSDFTWARKLHDNKN